VPCVLDGAGLVVCATIEAARSSTPVRTASMGMFDSVADRYTTGMRNLHD
jgi:hypothetical protein